MFLWHESMIQLCMHLIGAQHIEDKIVYLVIYTTITKFLGFLF